MLPSQVLIPTTSCPFIYMDRFFVLFIISILLLVST
jgi:hypothetical protein